jgi:preprotein translocase subunit SecA
VPIEAKMVTKAIERAQNTVEARNAEIRKDVLKYDEVMNEQRKVIYARRMQIIDGEDMREQTLELLESALQGVVDSACPTDEPEDWDLHNLVQEANGYYPTKFTPEEFADAATREIIFESILAEALAYYEERETSLPTDENGVSLMRQVEREIMLQIIDQRWREHLSEMDYLREGINLRAMGQQDPLVAWQTDGYEMFGQMMSGIDDDYVRYVMRAQVQVLQEVEQAEMVEDAKLGLAEYVAATEPVQPVSEVVEQIEQIEEPVPIPVPAPPAPAPVLSTTPVSPNLEQGVAGRGPAPALVASDEAEPAPNITGQIVKSEHEKLGRNQPCWCGSGKKFKLCHGR